jgi:hypothetical protein
MAPAGHCHIAGELVLRDFSHSRIDFKREAVGLLASRGRVERLLFPRNIAGWAIRDHNRQRD